MVLAVMETSKFCRGINSLRPGRKQIASVTAIHYVPIFWSIMAESYCILKGFCVLAEELEIIDAHAPLWPVVRPYLDAALRLEQYGEDYRWHGWHKQQITRFLATLPPHCSLIVGVWEVSESGDGTEEQEVLLLGMVCEVIAGEVRSLRTLAALTAADMGGKKQWKPGFEDAMEIMRAARLQVAPVAWALFTDKATWNEWVLTESEADCRADKGELLDNFARQGRCVLLGSQISCQRK